MKEKDVIEIGNVIKIEFDEELYKKNLEEFDWDSVEPEDGKGEDVND